MSSKLFTYETHAARDEHHWDESDCEEHGEILFRKFRSDGDDEQQMRELVFDNAFLGQPFDEICPCKEWFSDVVLNPESPPKSPPGREVCGRCLVK